MAYPADSQGTHGDESGQGRQQVLPMLIAQDEKKANDRRVRGLLPVAHCTEDKLWGAENCERAVVAWWVGVFVGFYGRCRGIGRGRRVRECRN